MGDLKVSETFYHRVKVKDSSGNVVIGLVAAGTISVNYIDESGNITSGTVTELGSGWYECRNIPWDVAGTWTSDWTVPAGDTLEHSPLMFKVGGGRIEDVYTDTTAIKAKTNNLPSDPADESAVEAAVTSAHTTTDGKVDAVKTVVDAVKAKTDNLPSDPADESILEALIASIAYNWTLDSSGEWTFTNVETTLVEKTTEYGLLVQANLAAMVAADAIRIRVYVKTKDGGTYRVYGSDGDQTYYDVQSNPVTIEVGPVYAKFSVKVTIQRTAGADDAKKVEWVCFKDR